MRPALVFLVPLFCGRVFSFLRKDSVDILRDFHLNALEEGKIESGRIAASYEMVLLPGLKTNKLTAVLFGLIHRAIG